MSRFIWISVFAWTSAAFSLEAPLSRGQRLEAMRRNLEAQQSRSDLLKEALCEHQTPLVCREIGDLDLSMKEFRGDIDDLTSEPATARNRVTESQVRAGLNKLTARIDRIIQREVPLEAE